MHVPCCCWLPLPPQPGCYIPRRLSFLPRTFLPRRSCLSFLPRTFCIPFVTAVPARRPRASSPARTFWVTCLRAAPACRPRLSSLPARSVFSPAPLPALRRHRQWIPHDIVCQGCVAWWSRPHVRVQLVSRCDGTVRVAAAAPLCANARLRAAPRRAAPHAARSPPCSEDFVRNKIDHLVTVRQADVYKEGFVRELDGRADAVFLDLPQPWFAVPHAYKCVRRRGCFNFYVSRVVAPVAHLKPGAALPLRASPQGDEAWCPHLLLLAVPRAGVTHVPCDGTPGI